MSTEEEAPQEPGRAQRLVTLMLVVALGVALIAVVMLWRDRDELLDRVDQAEHAPSASVTTAAETAARAAVTRMTTYDYKTVEEDFSWVDDAGTEEFQQTFTDASADAIELIKGFKSSAVGTVIDSAATAVDDDPRQGAAVRRPGAHGPRTGEAQARGVAGDHADGAPGRPVAGRRRTAPESPRTVSGPTPARTVGRLTA